jgi:predicted nucleic acid-binding protein
MILVDTSVIVAWLDPAHPWHRPCWQAIRHWAGKDSLAISSVTYAELAAGARTKEGVDEELSGFKRIELDFDSAWRAGQAYRKFRPSKLDLSVLPDFFIRAQAAVLSLPHLTNDRRRLQFWPEVDFILPRD